MTPGDVEAEGDEKARALLDPSVTETVRRQELSTLASGNPTLHAVVIKKMDQYRNQAGTLGRESGLQQMGIGQQQPQTKTASAGQIGELMVRLHQEFPVPAGHDPHSIREQKNGRLILRIFHKGACSVAMISPEDLDESIEGAVKTIKDAIV